MEVKVQYVTELNKILDEVNRMLPTSMEWTYELNVASTFLNKGEAGVAISIIDATRKSMYNIDQRLADCQAILEGYLSTQKQPSNQELNLENLGDMNEKLQDMVSMIQPQGDTDGTTS